MEYFDKPSPKTIPNVFDQDRKPLVLTADQFLDQIVWTMPVWRSSKDHLETMRRLRAAFGAATDGGEVEATKADHERLLQSLQSLDLSQRPHLTEATGEFAYGLMCSRQEPRSRPVVEPEPKKEAPALPAAS